MIRLAIMVARYYFGRLRTPAWLVARRRRAVAQLSMVCACGAPALAWLTGWWGRREFCGECLMRRHRRRRVIRYAVLVAALVAAIVEGWRDGGGR